jgi:hypothetical protein
LANQPTEIPSNYSVGGGPRETYRHTPLTQEQKDAHLSDAINENQLAREDYFGISPKERIGNLMGLPVGIPLGTVARTLGNQIQGIRPNDTSRTFDWYEGDTNSQGAPIGPSGAYGRGLQGTYGSQYEKDVASMYGEGSDEHMNAISEGFGDDSTVSGGGLFGGGMGGGGLLSVSEPTEVSSSDRAGGGYSPTTGTYGGMDFTSTGDMTGGDFSIGAHGYALLDSLVSDINSQLGLSGSRGFSDFGGGIGSFLLGIPKK